MNAKEELQDVLKGLSKIKCAIIYSENPEFEFVEKKEPIAKLIVGYNKNQLKNFFHNLDFNYDNGFGSQELYGLVWLEDGTWLSRDEYDGAENWIHNILPEIPNILL